MTYRELWIKTFLTGCRVGLSAEHAAEKADKAVKELKLRDADPTAYAFGTEGTV